MIGRIISRYRVDAEIGAGGMGVVFRGTDLRLGRTVALKFLAPDLTRDEDAKQRFLREAQAASSLDHPNICTIYGFEETDDGRLCLVMAHYAGETLKTKLGRGAIPLSEAVGIAAQIARGLGKAHQRGIIHRDIKPANVMITDDGEVKILDFGLAKLAGDHSLTKQGSVVGSPQYMSPEQISGEVVDHRADIWSLGVVLYEMVSGQPLYRGESVAAVFHAIVNREMPPLHAPPAVEPILKRMLARAPSERYATTDELLRDLNTLAASSPTGSFATAVKPVQQRIPSIAVLPFVDMSSGHDQEYFCAGVAEEILNALTQINGLRVAARTSSFVFRTADHDIRTIGERLNVNTILEGSLRKAGDRLRVTVHLVNVADGYRLWSKRYDSELKDVFAIQDEIAESIARALEPRLRDNPGTVRKAKRTALEAYDYYLRGRKLIELRERSLQLAREMFERSAETDPGYALAYAGIADASSWLYQWFTGDTADLQTADASSRRALALSPELAESHVARGSVLSLQKLYDEAAAEFEKAIDIKPNTFDAWHLYSRIRLAQDRPEDALRLAMRASEIQPDDFQALLVASAAELRLGHEREDQRIREEIVRRVERRLQIDPDDIRAMYIGGVNLVRIGGDQSRADALLRRAIAEDPLDRMLLYNVACYYVLTGRNEEALDCLEKAISDRPGFFRNWVEHDADLDPVRNDPRFQSLISKLE
ncbi:MAG TPA: protein kinase [Gemmatimonadaceae bacterium]